MSAARFVAYYRVSTDKQGRSGLGLEAQRAAVEAHVAGTRGTVATEFVEVESGRKKDRPQLAAALAAARAHRAVLVIAKLDRLARNVHFVSGLMESGVEFVAADMPVVNRLTVHILAAVAEEEARMISARTKAALAAAKARGVRLGNPNLAAGSPAQARAANAVKSGRAEVRAADVLPFIEHRPGVQVPPPCSSLPTRWPLAACRHPPVAAGAGTPCRWPASSGDAALPRMRSVRPRRAKKGTTGCRAINARWVPLTSTRPSPSGAGPTSRISATKPQSAAG